MRWRNLQNRNRCAALARRGGKLEADEPAADDDDARAWLELLTQEERIVIGSQQYRVLAAFQRKAARPRARRQQQALVRDFAALARRQSMLGAIDRDNAQAGEPLDAEIGKAARVGDRRRRRLSLAGQRRLGERRALVRGMPFFADQRQRAAPAILAQRNGGARRPPPPRRR